MTTTAQNVIDFVNSWGSNNGISSGDLTQSQLLQFARDLQTKLADVSVLPDTKPTATPIPYTDIMSGDDHNDMLFGGAGNDRMTGDYGKLVYDGNDNDYFDGGKWINGWENGGLVSAFPFAVNDKKWRAVA